MKAPKFKITGAAPLHRAASGGMMGRGLLRAVVHEKIAHLISPARMAIQSATRACSGSSPARSSSISRGRPVRRPELSRPTPCRKDPRNLCPFFGLQTSEFLTKQQCHSWFVRIVEYGHFGACSVLSIKQNTLAFSAFGLTPGEYRRMIVRSEYLQYLVPGGE